MAYCLASMAEIRPGDTVLDPFCGHGTIAVEAAVENPTAHIVAADIDPAMVTLTRANIEHSHQRNISAMQCDAAYLPLRAGSVDVLVTDLPFGKKHGVQDINKLIANFIAECVRVVRIGGRVVVMTYHEAALAKAIQHSQPDLDISAIHPLRLGKLEASVFVMERVTSLRAKHEADDSDEPQPKHRYTAE